MGEYKYMYKIFIVLKDKKNEKYKIRIYRYIIKLLQIFNMDLQKTDYPCSHNEQNKNNNEILENKINNEISEKNAISPVEFQIIDWSWSHEEQNDVEKYTILLFGKTLDEKSVFVTVTDFTPYFFVNVPQHWGNTHMNIYIEEIQKKLSNQYKNALLDASIMEKYKFVGFTNFTKFKFIRLKFKSYKAMRTWSYVCGKPIFNRNLANNKFSCELYESNIEPMLRCMHIRELKACGWVKINNYKESDVKTCDINIITKWTELQPVENDTIAKLVIASFDIECISDSSNFPVATNKNDTIIQIGTTFSKYGELDCYFKHIVVLGTCNEIPGATVESYDNEKDLLLAWRDLIIRTNPDIVTGYNIFGFDYDYICERSKILGIEREFARLSRIDNITEFKRDELKSSAMGQNKFLYYNMIGRVNVDLMKYIQRNYSLPSYKLDNVTSHFIKESIIKIDGDKIYTESTYGIEKSSFVNITYFDGLTDNTLKKFRVIDIGNEEIQRDDSKSSMCPYFQVDTFVNTTGLETYKMYWAQAKDDITPNEIFDGQKGSAEDRKNIAIYCLKDCVLCNILFSKLQIINNNVGMANVCSVPLSYLFMRGQGIKIFSLVSKKCRKLDYLIPLLKKFDEATDIDEKYEGATVLEPIVGVHSEPVVVLDYASLYPRSMICRNLSHECLVTDPQYDNLDGYIYNTIKYTNEDGTVTECTFAKAPNEHGILPSILLELLDERAKTRKKMKNITSSFLKAILDGLQLAFKVSANSLYGSTGAKTSSIYLKHIAACTTAIGREMLLFAKTFIEKNFANVINNAKPEKREKFMKITGPININHDKVFNDIYNLMQDMTINPCIIYGDTDSVFFAPRIMKNNVVLKDKSILEIAIKLGIIAGDFINKILPSPMEIEYEKTFYPFCILSKKRYVGNLYEFNPNKFYQKNMGVVLKRRDNAPIVKIACGGIVREILNHNPRGAVTFIKETLIKILRGEYQMDKFIITKTLKGDYADRETIAHAVLADRMTKREPGNAPRVNDRIPYVYVQLDYEPKLQGERIEHPDFVIKNNLKIDYLFYITNQIMKPCVQFLEVIMENPTELFNRLIIIEKNRRKGKMPISSFMKSSM